MVVVAAAFVWAAWVALSGHEPDQRPVAIPMLTSIVGGLFGYIVKK